MIVLAALLLAIFIASLGWLIAINISNQKILEARASAAFIPEQWTPRGEETLKVQNKNTFVTFEDCGKDRFKKDLFLAGVRTRSSFNLAVAVSRWVVLSPFVYIGYKYLIGKLDMNVFFTGAGVFLLLLIASRLPVRFLSIRRQGQIRRRIPEFFDLMIVCFEAGLNFTAALPRVIKESSANEPLVKELDMLHSEYLAGLPLSSACDRAATRCQIPELTRMLTAIVQSDKMGASLGVTLRVLVSELRDKLKQSMREKAYKIPVKLIFPIALMLVGVLLPLLFGSVFFNLLTALKSLG